MRKNHKSKKFIEEKRQELLGIIRVAFYEFQEQTSERIEGVEFVIFPTVTVCGVNHLIDIKLKTQNIGDYLDMLRKRITDREKQPTP